MYEYDYFADAVLKMQNAVAFNYSGLLYKFNRDEAYPMEVDNINGLITDYFQRAIADLDGKKVRFYIIDDILVEEY